MTQVYLFGSNPRGDFDLSSDNDALLISNSWGNVSRKIHMYEKAGFDITFFPFNKAKYLIKSGSLFFKHIKDEGQLIEGNINDSVEFLSNWKAKNSYQDEVDENIDLLELLRYLPKNHKSNLIANDIISISIRNIIIRRLAEVGVYSFSWDTIIDNAINHGFINSEQKNFIKTARLYKNMYRNGNSITISDDFINEVIMILNSLVKNDICIDRIGESLIKQKLNKLEAYSYKWLRLTEIISSLYSTKDSSEELAYLRKLYKNPNYVSSIFKNSYERKFMNY